MKLIHSDCREALKVFQDDSIDAIVTDPPYALVQNSRNSSAQPGDMTTPYGGSGPSKRRGFMGKEWDNGEVAFDPAFWVDCLRVLKPGGHLLAFGGSRTYHRLASAIEHAGFEIRDQIMWLYGSGFPKSLDVSKAIDKAAGQQRERIRGVRSGVVKDTYAQDEWSKAFKDSVLSSVPITNAARQWQGWGTALKPAHEPIVLARKPLVGTVVENVLTHGTGGINVDACRVETNPEVDDPRLAGNGMWKTDKMAQNVYEGGYAGQAVGSSPLGRWPANIIHDGSEEVVERFPHTKSGKPGIMRKGTNGGPVYGSESRPPGTPMTGFGDEGSAARFFKSCHADVHAEAAEYAQEKGRVGEATATKRYTDEGGTNFAPLPGIRREPADTPAKFFYCAKANRKDRGDGNNHPTVKPTELMRYLVRLVTPQAGTVLDPFMGSGSTGKACILEGFDFIGIEKEEAYYKIAVRRLEEASA